LGPACPTGCADARPKTNVSIWLHCNGSKPLPVSQRPRIGEQLSSDASLAHEMRELYYLIVNGLIHPQRQSDQNSTTQSSPSGGDRPIFVALVQRARLRTSPQVRRAPCPSTNACCILHDAVFFMTQHSSRRSKRCGQARLQSPSGRSRALIFNCSSAPSALTLKQTLPSKPYKSPRETLRVTGKGKPSDRNLPTQARALLTSASTAQQRNPQRRAQLWPALPRISIPCLNSCAITLTVLACSHMMTRASNSKKTERNKFTT
jgi:hypothetical protein